MDHPNDRAVPLAREFMATIDGSDVRLRFGVVCSWCRPGTAVKEREAAVIHFGQHFPVILGPWASTPRGDPRPTRTGA